MLELKIVWADDPWTSIIATLIVSLAFCIRGYIGYMKNKTDKGLMSKDEVMNMRLHENKKRESN